MRDNDRRTNRSRGNKRSGNRRRLELGKALLLVRAILGRMISTMKPILDAMNTIARLKRHRTRKLSRTRTTSRTTTTRTLSRGHDQSRNLIISNKSFRDILLSRLSNRRSMLQSPRLTTRHTHSGRHSGSLQTNIDRTVKMDRIHSIEKNRANKIINSNKTRVSSRLKRSTNQLKTLTKLTNIPIQGLSGLLDRQKLNQMTMLCPRRSSLMPALNETPHTKSILGQLESLIIRLIAQGFLRCIRQTTEHIDHKILSINFTTTNGQAKVIHEILEPSSRLRSHIRAIRSRDMQRIGNNSTVPKRHRRKTNSRIANQLK